MLESEDQSASKCSKHLVPVVRQRVGAGGVVEEAAAPARAIDGGEVEEVHDGLVVHDVAAVVVEALLKMNEGQDERMNEGM